MAKIKPFKGILYNKKEIGDLPKVVTPPYDVIPSQEVDTYYGRHSYNIIRLILNKSTPKDSPVNNRYTRARDLFNKWLSEGILKQDVKDSIYVYEQVYKYKDCKKDRWGFIALLKLEEEAYRNVLPHESTYEKPKQDRLQLIKQVRANLSPIFSLFEDKEETILSLKIFCQKYQPYIDINFDDGRHKLWRITNQRIIQRVIDNMKDKRIYIADGHHRYEVSIAFRKFIRGYSYSLKDANSDFNYVLMYFSNLQDDSVTILPVHRVVKNTKNLNTLIVRINKFFEIRKFLNKEDLLSNLENQSQICTFGLYYENNYYLLKFRAKEDSIRNRVSNSGDLKNITEIFKMKNHRKLDVVILHNLIFNNILKIKETNANIHYTHNIDKVIDMVNSRNFDIAFFLRPVKISQVKTIAEMQNKMPKKSTYFYPKLLTGLVIRKINMPDLAKIK